jgi:hypothetical protein
MESKETELALKTYFITLHFVSELVTKEDGAVSLNRKAAGTGLYHAAKLRYDIACV